MFQLGNEQLKNIINKILWKLRLKEPSLIEALYNLIDIEVLEETVLNLKDWRSIIHELSQRLSKPEIEIWKSVSEYFSLDYLENIPNSNFWALPHGLTSENLEKNGIAPLTIANQLVGVVCLDPKRLKSLGLAKKGLAVYLSNWTSIKESLSESNLIFEESRIYREENQNKSEQIISQKDRSLAELILIKVIEEAIFYAASEATLTFGSDVVQYEFPVAGGKMGNGEVNAKIGPRLLRLLRDINDSNSSFKLGLSKLEEVVVSSTFLPGFLTTVRVVWADSEKAILKNNLNVSKVDVI